MVPPGGAKLMPRKAKKRLVIRSIPSLGLAAVTLVGVLILGWSGWVMVATGWAGAGWSFGALLGWRDGWKERQESLEQNWGEDWLEELAYGHYVHMKYEEAEKN